jgi:tetratricopeptide (TPR) repeat protein
MLLGSMLALAAPAAALQEHDPAAQEPASEHASRSSTAPDRRLLSISQEEGPQGPLWTVRCEDVTLEEFLAALARKAAVTLVGAASVPAGARLSVHLERRSLARVLDVTLGSHGLRHELRPGTLRVFADAGEPEELLRRAAEAWRAVEARDEARGASARLAQGHLAEVRGDLDAAYGIYSELGAEEHAADAAEALYRAGRVLERLGHWAEAAQHFRTLADKEEGVAFHARARLELARTSIELGDAKSAVHLLNFLEAHFPTTDEEVLAERRLVRARALLERRQFVEALRLLVEGDVGSAPDARARTLAIRAEALEGLGFEREASHAWLLAAREATSSADKAAAFQRSGALALSAGDEVGALFVGREAAKEGADEGLGACVEEARARLGLGGGGRPLTTHERLALGEALIARGEPARAAALFEDLVLARSALAEPDQARVVAGWARILAQRSGVDAALDVLGQARRTLGDPEARRSLDLAAARLLEDEGRFEEAADAYAGDY